MTKQKVRINEGTMKKGNTSPPPRESRPNPPQGQGYNNPPPSSNGSENRLYCSEECKKNCGVYRMQTTPKGFGRIDKFSDSRDKEWKEMILERDNYTCQECGSTENLVSHHIIPVAEDYILSSDISNGICLCSTCHSKKHKKITGCRYNELRDLCK